MSYTGLRDAIAKMQERIYDEYYPDWREEMTGLKAALNKKPVEWKNDYFVQWTKVKKEPRDKDHRVDALCYAYSYKPFTISKEEMNMAYDSSFNGKLDSDCATGPSSAVIEREKITISKSEYDELRKALTEWQTMAGLLGIAHGRYNGDGPTPTDVFNAFKEALTSAENQIAYNLTEYKKSIAAESSAAFAYMQQRDTALEDLKKRTAEIKAMKKRKRTK